MFRTIPKQKSGISCCLIFYQNVVFAEENSGGFLFLALAIHMGSNSLNKKIRPLLYMYCTSTIQLLIALFRLYSKCQFFAVFVIFRKI